MTWYIYKQIVLALLKADAKQAEVAEKNTWKLRSKGHNDRSQNQLHFLTTGKILQS